MSTEGDRSVFPVASSVLGRHALECLKKAVAAVEPEALVREFFAHRPEYLARPVSVIGLGKAAAAMARGIADVRGLDVERGVLVLPAALADSAPAGFEIHAGSHPVPDEAGSRGARAMLEMAQGLGAGDLLVVLVSGGGSALGTLPPVGLSLEDLQLTTTALLRAGATISETNAVRKHLDQIKGGRLARAAAPARVVALVLSDVVGNPLDVIASGPVSPDPTTFLDALKIVERYDLAGELPEAVLNHLEQGAVDGRAESPKAGDPCFEAVEVEIIGDNRRAAEAAMQHAEKLGYQPLLLTTTLSGEARYAGETLASIAREIRTSGQPISAPACVIAAGETTVTVKGEGRGGRNQELALGAVNGLAGLQGVVLAAFGTDGIDGPTNAAGALVSGGTLERAIGESISVDDHLERNDAYAFFERLDDLIITGATGTNVMDLAVVLVAD